MFDVIEDMLGEEILVEMVTDGGQLWIVELLMMLKKL